MTSVLLIEISARFVRPADRTWLLKIITLISPGQLIHLIWRLVAYIALLLIGAKDLEEELNQFELNDSPDSLAEWQTSKFPQFEFKRFISPIISRT